MAAKTCDVCGKPSGFYPLCTSCFVLRDKGEIVKDEKTNKWVKVENKEPSKAKIEEPKEKKPEAKEEEKPVEKHSECIVCGEEANGYLFCRQCYSKYWNTRVLAEIRNCKDITFIRVIDDYEENLLYICKDGHKVRSKSERDIDNYLFDHKIAHAYEKPLPIDDNKEHDLHPDFYLPNEDIYIEHWGMTNKKDYQQQKEYKIEIYKKLGITLISTTEEDIQDTETALTRKLKFRKEGINE